MEDRAGQEKDHYQRQAHAAKLPIATRTRPGTLVTGPDAGSPGLVTLYRHQISR
jgi:hypothetical protein